MKAKAKINLFLHVLGKNAKNYHNLESLVVFANDVYDEIEIIEDKETSVNLSGEFANTLINDTQDNILKKTIDILRPYSTNNYKFNLRKNIAVAAGLGGGSADSATALKYLVDLWKINISTAEIQDLCVKLGADVYCCYFSQASYFSGIGEVLHPIKQMPQIYGILVNPKKEVCTKEIFAHLNPSSYSKELLNKPDDFKSAQELIEFVKAQNNDLQPVASKLLPEIDEIISIIKQQDQCLLSRMSGSGATCFGLFPSMELASKATTLISQKYQQFWVKPTSFC